MVVKKVLAKAALSLLGIMLALVLLEIFVRLFPSIMPWPVRYQIALPAKYDPIMGTIQVPNITRHLQSPEFSYTVVTTDLGLSDIGFRDDGMDHDFIILALGDSFTWGVGVEDREVWPEILENRLEVDVINAGMAGFGTTQERLLLERYADKLHPSLVIIAFFPNDLADNVTWKEEANIGSRTGALTMSIRVWLHTNVYLYELGKYYLLGALLGRGPYASSFKAPAPSSIVEVDENNLELRLALHSSYLLKEYPPLLEQGWETGQEDLLKIKETCARLGSDLLVVIFPTKEQVYWEYVRPHLQKAEAYDPDRPDALVKGFCQKENIPVLDTTPLFRAKSHEQLYWKINGHWNEKGHLLAAQLIHDYLVNHPYRFSYWPHD